MRGQPARQRDVAQLADRAFVQPRHAVRLEGVDQVRLVTDHDEAAAGGALALHQLDHRAQAVDVHAGVDLVQDRQPRLQQRQWAPSDGIAPHAARRALAQAAGLLAFDAMGQVPDENNIYYFVGIDGARFKRPVEPGDQLILDITIDRVRGGIWKFKGVAKVGEEVACEAELMCTMRAVG